MVAAIFDLDRTLVAGSVIPTLSRSLLDMGIDVPQPPGRSLLYGIYDRIGEDPVSMRVAARAARLFTGHSVRRVRAAGRMAADVLASRLLPGAHDALEWHRSEGHELLLATSVPAIVAEPFAAAAGIDNVICTVWGERHGRFDGSNESGFVWGPRKLELVTRWAAEHSIDLSRSWAYTDSVYDADLLQAVAHPVAVNADVRLARLARRNGWGRRTWTDID